MNPVSVPRDHSRSGTIESESQSSAAELDFGI